MSDASQATEPSQPSDASEISAPTPRPGRSWRPVWLALAVIALAAVGVPLGGAAVLVGPYLLDDWRLDHVVRAVALDWRDFGRDKAKERLQYELDHQRVGQQIGDDTCNFVEQAGGDRSVDCRWAVSVRIPGTKSVIPLAFASTATITAAGDLQ
jgi:hypothetical protein